MRIAALASAVALAGLTPAVAAPLFVPGTPVAQSGVIQVQDSAKIVRRDRFHRNDGGWKKKRLHFHDKRHRDRDHDHDRRDGLHRPKDTPKFAYDADGNLRIFDRDRRWRDDGWHDWDGRDWDRKRRKRPHIIKMNSFGFQEPSPELKKVLTAVPD